MNDPNLSSKGASAPDRNLGSINSGRDPKGITAPPHTLFNTVDPDRSWSRKAAIFSIYLYIASLYVIAYSAEYGYISKILFIVMLGMTVLDVFANRINSVFDKPSILILAFLAWAAITSLWVVNDEGVSDLVYTLIQLVGLYFIIKLNIRSLFDVRRIINAIIVGTLIMCLYTVHYYGIPHIAHCIATGGRIGQEINQVNGMGLYCSIMITMMAYMILYEKKWYYLLAMPLAIFVQLGCGSRKGFAMVIVGVLIVAFFRAGNKKLLFLFGALGAVAIALYIIYTFADQNYFFYRILQTLALVDNDVTMTDKSITDRQLMVQLGIELFKKKPLQGYGPMQFEYYYNMYYGGFRPPHTTYIQMLVSFGSIGFGLYYSIYLYYIKYIVKVMRAHIRYAPLFLAIIAMMLANDLGANMLNHKYSYIFLALIGMYIFHARRLMANGLKDEIIMGAPKL